MRFKDRAKNVVNDICVSLGAEPDDQQAKIMADIVEKALLQVVLDERENFMGAALNVCSPDKDRAHKFESEMKRQHEALIANLQGMR